MHLTLLCVQISMYQFLSNLVWWQTRLNSTAWYQSKWPWPSLKAKGIQDSSNLCKCSVVKRHEVAKAFAKFGFSLWLQQRSPVSVLNMDHLSICSSCIFQQNLETLIHNLNLPFHNVVFLLYCFAKWISDEQLHQLLKLYVHIATNGI